MSEVFPKSIAVISDIGLRRKENEDMALVAGMYIRDNSLTIEENNVSYPFLAAVADGMGGHAAGEVASETALRSLEKKIKALPPQTWDNEKKASEKISAIITDLHSEILHLSKENPELEKMGNTLTGIVIGAPDIIYLFHAGDTRLYLFQKGQLNQLTRDHSLKGENSHSFASNVLVNAMGGGIEKFYVDVQQISGNIHSGDLLLLSSDGLHDKVPHDEIVAVLKMDISFIKQAQLLLQKALQAGGYDNISIALLAF